MPTPRDRSLIYIYAAAIFTSAFLLFQIQPIVSKRMLPWFGGSAAVWTTSLLFFQSFLFAGYAYAHWMNSCLRPRQQALLHVGLIIAALVLLPALPGDDWQPTGAESPIPRILLILTVSVGLPYFVLSATGPLLQAWFTRSFSNRVPYRLYALSNLGSLLALVSYPFIFEPTFNLRGQSRLWTVGFIVYAGLCAYIAWQIQKSVPSPAGRGQGEGASAASGARSGEPVIAPQHWQYAYWLVLSAFGSLVLIATTNHISSDIAVMPLLWVVPLAIYLLTFIIAFDRPAWYRRVPIAILAIVAIYAAAATHHFGLYKFRWYDFGTVGIIRAYFADPAALPTGFNFAPPHFLIANFATMFAICMLCHGELVRSRPAPRFLTAYYLMISAGGALGGIFATLVAPTLFTTYFEWDAALFVAALASIGIVLYAGGRQLYRMYKNESASKRFIFSAGAMSLIAVVLVLIMIDLSEFLGSQSPNVRWRARNFFGALNIEERDKDDDYWRRNVLVHGATTHGSQYTNETRRREPTTYFGKNGCIGYTMKYFQKHLPAGKFRSAVVGLGAGTIAAYPNAGDSITFYEINPTVVDIAEQGTWFTYLRDCRQRGARCDVRLGDGRLTLSRERQQDPGQSYHLIVLDAFSGDSIPAHLLTKQAFEVYLANLTRSKDGAGKPDEAGAIAVHISNLYLDLEPVVRAMVLQFKFLPLAISNLDDPAHDVFPADWIVLTRNPKLAAELALYARPVTITRPPALWTDDHSSLFDVLRWTPIQ